jgi:hypothetical protein
MLDQIGRHFRDDNGERSALALSQFHTFCQDSSMPTGLPGMRGVGYVADHLFETYFHRVTTTFVPSPTFD